MNRFRTRGLAISAAILSLCAYSTAASAQATRTWVSGVGDDVNPCSRTAPCKTFAGAISKTAAGGEINCLDPGGFGAVTITKALTIDCHFTEGGVLAGGNGIVVNAGSTDVVVLRGLDIFGVAPPTHGVRFIAGGALQIEDCVIRRFNSVASFGISFQPTGAAKLYVSNTVISGNGNGTGGGINVVPTASGSAKVVLRQVQVQQNSGTGLNIDANTSSAAGVQVVVEDSQFSGNTAGVSSNASGIAATTFINGSSIAQNSATGLSVSGNASSMVVSNSTITGNATGLAESGGSIIYSFADNRLEANPNFATPNNGAFNGALTKK